MKVQQKQDKKQEPLKKHLPIKTTIASKKIDSIKKSDPNKTQETSHKINNPAPLVKKTPSKKIPNTNVTSQTQQRPISSQIKVHKSTEIKNYSMSSDTVKKILLSFYPNDKSLFDIILSSLNKSTFLFELDKYYSKLEEFSNKDPFNKYYGVQSSTKISFKENQTSIDLNKENTDAIFSLVDQILASFGTKLNLNTIKGNINRIYKCHNLNRINFLSNKEKNLKTKYPVNFYAFCIALRILIECYSDQIKYFDLGIFMNSTETLFGKENNDCFLSELFCCYILFLYFYSLLTKNHDIALTLHFFDETNIYDSYTFHIKEGGYEIVNSILGRNKNNYDLMTLLKDIFTVNLSKLNFNLHYNISKEVYDEILSLINCQDYLTKVEFHCNEIFLNKSTYNILKDINKCTELNFYLNNFNNLGGKKKINLKNEKLNTTNFSIDGDNLFIDNISKNLNNLNSLKLISNNNIYDIEKNNNENICFNLNKDIFASLTNITELTLKYLSLEQFITLVTCLTTKSKNNLSKILKLNLEIDYTNANIDNSSNENVNKLVLLKSIHSLINICPRISDIREFNINLINNSKKTNFLLTIENGLYFIDLVFNKLKSCYQFSLINNNNYYYPANEEKPDITLTGNGKVRKRNLKKKVEDEEFSMVENSHNCKCDWNNNSEIYVSYSGNEFSDYCKILDYSCILPFLFAIGRKNKKLKDKNVLVNIAKYLDVCKKVPKQFSVVNFNN